MTAPASAVARYLDGVPVPDAFPMFTADQQERLQSGLHGQCYDAVMAPIDEELAGEQDS